MTTRQVGAGHGLRCSNQVLHYIRFAPVEVRGPSGAAPVRSIPVKIASFSVCIRTNEVPVEQFPPRGSTTLCLLSIPNTTPAQESRSVSQRVGLRLVPIKFKLLRFAPDRSAPDSVRTRQVRIADRSALRQVRTRQVRTLQCPLGPGSAPFRSAPLIFAPDRSSPPRELPDSGSRSGRLEVTVKQCPF